jgi:2-oxoglutarate ferredoxin oxidoreductase subunit alpha
MATSTEVPPSHKKKETIEQAVIRFCGDSGDGMQITGSQFTNTAALFGNDLATFPDFPAEIRAPAGTLPGVSGFQVNFSSRDVFTPGDMVDVLVAMNPAALATNVADLKTNGILIVNTDDFKDSDLKKAQAKTNPLEDHSLDGYRLFKVDLTRLTRLALSELGLDAKSMDRCKNFFALGMCYWLYNRSMDGTHKWLDEKFSSKPVLAEANKLAMKAGLHVLRRHRGVPDELRDPAGQAEPGRVPQHQRQHRPRPRLRGRLAEGGDPALPRQLPDHARVRHPARALDVQGVRRDHVPGRGRDRGGDVVDRRRLRGAPGPHHDLRPGHGPQDGGHRPRHRDRSCRS